jgi:mitogen-activated protein kinase 1/3
MEHVEEANKRIRPAFDEDADTPPTAANSVAETPREPNGDQYDVETPRYSESSTGGASSGRNIKNKKPTLDEFSHWEVNSKDYKLIRILGSGSYGDVAEALDLASQCTVAIKRIHNVFDQPTDTKRILREVNILRYVVSSFVL